MNRLKEIIENIKDLNEEFEALLEQVNGKPDLSRCDDDPMGDYAKNLIHRDGSVRIIAVFKNNDDDQPYFAVGKNSNDELLACSYTEDGHYFKSGTISENDLIYIGPEDEAEG